MKLAHLNAIVTGASQGLGKAVAKEFLLQGANVVLCARDAELLAKTCAELAADGNGRVLARRCDVSDEPEVADLADFAIREFGRIDALICNAGVQGPLGPTEDVDLREWIRTIEINLFGVLLPCRALIPHFKRNGRGKIVMLSGGGATNPLPNISAYCASKAALVRFMETLAEELRAHRIEVNAVAPGALKTRLLDQVIAAGPEGTTPEYFAKIKTWSENGATPLELAAGLCAYLASAESDGITGKLISAKFDPWRRLHEHRNELGGSDIYCLRRIVPEDRGLNWNVSAT